MSVRTSSAYNRTTLSFINPFVGLIIPAGPLQDVGRLHGEKSNGQQQTQHAQQNQQQRRGKPGEGQQPHGTAAR